MKRGRSLTAPIFSDGPRRRASAATVAGKSPTLFADCPHLRQLRTPLRRLPLQQALCAGFASVAMPAHVQSSAVPYSGRFATALLGATCLHTQAIYFIPYFFMSVFVLSPEEFGSIAATIRLTTDSFRRPILPLSWAERWEFAALVGPNKKEDEDAYRRSLIDPFVFRLYLANVMAEQYTYAKDHTKEFVIPLFELKPGKILSLPKLLRTLESLRYNIVTNGGNTFLGVKDDEKLHDLIEAIKTELIHEPKAA